MTDGASNTIAFSGRLVTNGGSQSTAASISNTFPGNSVTGVGDSRGRLPSNTTPSANPAAILTGLVACNTAFASKAGINNLRGVFMGESARSA